MVCPENSTPGRLVHEIPWGQWEGDGIEKSAAGRVTRYTAARSAAEVFLRMGGMQVVALTCHPQTELTATSTHQPLRGPARSARGLGVHEKTQGHILERLPPVCDPSVRRCHSCHLRNALRFGLFNQGPAIDQAEVSGKILSRLGLWPAHAHGPPETAAT